MNFTRYHITYLLAYVIGAFSILTFETLACWVLWNIGFVGVTGALRLSFGQVVVLVALLNVIGRMFWGLTPVRSK